MWIFLLLLFLFIIWPIIRAAMIVNRVKKNARQAYESMYGNQQPRNDAGRKAGWSSSEKKRKKIDRTVGDYVPFEDMPAQNTGSKPHTTPDFTAESQISDAEWEEIK